ncbi:MAG: transpeptidase family protein [Bacteroidales bacterium]|nr:transpeptidase family protein [Bacteroidales bacterium]
MQNHNTEEKGRRRTSNMLILFHVVFLCMAVAIIGKIVYLQFIWEPDPRYVKYFQPKKDKNEIDPQRGSIIDYKGKLLAMSTPMYNVHMDCYVLKEEYASMKDKEKGAKKEQEWISKAQQLADKLPEVLKEDGRNAAYYRDLILTGRRNKRRYVAIAKDIDHSTLLELKKLPLFCEGRNQSGMIIEEEETRQYPYDGLARRVIGYVRNNSDTNALHIGIEGEYNHHLRGKKGVEWMKVTDGKGMIQNMDSSFVAVENGLDIRTTLDINIQDIADRSLRANMAQEEDIVGGCVVVLDVETGAIRAMVNLQKDKRGEFREVFNMAAGRPAEPGSVFKAVTMTTLLEDGLIKLEDKLPTNHGVMSDMPKVNRDEYITSYERNNGVNQISIIDGFKISSNYVFRRLVKDNYGEKPEKFINRLHEYNFGEAYEFELEESGSARPRIPDPESAGWTIYDLVSVAIGYSVRVTPLQVATFYNAIANNGKMMKPYVVESIEDEGRVVRNFKPQILNGSICSKATADTLTRALKMVTLEGTASRLKNAKCTVAGKTGTSRMHLTNEERAGSRDPYSDINGRKKHQATFVGFFPADQPKYTAIVVVYTGLMSNNVYGGKIPAMTFKDIVDGIWAYDTEWGNVIKEKGSIPQMREEPISTAKGEDAPVPDLKGLGLKDAIFAIENNGYRFSHSGTGHVVSQTPKAGTKAKKGDKISIVLK